MRNVATLPAADRRALFANTASKTGLTDAIIEKDFWVCWTLDYLFHRSAWKKHLAFKGGTSLSKAFQLIERFSEDLDLVLDWRLLGYDMDEPWAQRSKTQQARFNDEANRRTADFLREKFVVAMQVDISSELGVDVEIKPDTGDEHTILFKYPQEFSSQSILQEIRLEIGTLAVWSPSIWKNITPYSAEQYPHIFSSPTTNVLTVQPIRTFWEKATILHQEANRPNDSVIPLRYSRHYYDLYRLSESWVKKAALSDLEMLRQVSVFKEKFYPRGWARYDNARPGSMKLMPPQHSLDILEDDYKHMQNMLFNNKPSFSMLMEGLLVLEREINSKISNAD